MKIKISKLLFLTFFFLLILGRFILIPKNILAASPCNQIIIEPGLITKNNSITIRDSRIIDSNIYNIQIFGFGNYRISNIIAEGNIVQGTISLGQPLLMPGSVRILLEHGNKDDVCEKNVQVSFPRDCRWQVSPSNPYANNPMTINLTSSVASLSHHAIRKNVKVKELNGDIKVVSNEINSFTYTPKEKGNYLFTAEILYVMSSTNLKPFTVCTVAINVGENSQNPGRGITDQEDIIPPETGITKKLCQEDSGPCTTCFGEGNTWTALGCIPTTSLNKFVGWILGRFIFVASGIAFLLMVVGAFQILTSAGTPEKVKAGKELITSALTGLIFIILSMFILKLIGVDILHLPEFANN